MYKLPDLPYLFQDLEPFIDTHTMGLHYHKHEQNYLNKLNSVLQKNNYDFRYSLVQLIQHINDFPQSDKEDILFNLGGILNHNLYFKSMSAKAQKPTGKLKNKIEEQYGSYSLFFEKIKESALALKGVGYVFVVLKSDGNLDIINMLNQETPLSMGLIPLFNIDMWEHAYYLNYKNDKVSYLDNFAKVADFTNASDIFEKVILNMNL